MASAHGNSCLTLRQHFSCAVLLLMVLSMSLLEFAQGQSCDRTIPPKNKCSCSYDDGTGTKTPIDFTPLGRNDGNPAFPYKPNGDYKYAYNPCFAFSDGDACQNVAACQASNDGKLHYDIGDPDAPIFSVADKDIVITYTGAGSRQSIVHFQCDPSALHAAIYTVQGEDPPSTFNFEIKTCLACVPAVNGCHVSSGGGLSVGGILCIVFTVLLVVYLVGGILFQKYARGATGKEMIPNYGFWSDFPTLVKDGCMFLVGLCRGTSTDYETIK